jgi:hypothetical protein
LLLTLHFPNFTIHRTWRALADLLIVKWSTNVSEMLAQHLQAFLFATTRFPEGGPVRWRARVCDLLVTQPAITRRSR